MNFSTGAAAMLDLRPDPRVVRIEEGAHVLRVEPLGIRREAHEIDEDHRDDAPLLARRPGLGERWPHARQNRAMLGLS